MLIEKKIFGAKCFDGGVEGFVLEKHGAENGTLGVEIIWERAFESGFRGHGCDYFAFYSPTVTRERAQFKRLSKK